MAEIGKLARKPILFIAREDVPDGSKKPSGRPLGAVNKSAGGEGSEEGRTRQRFCSVHGPYIRVPQNLSKASPQQPVRPPSDLASATGPAWPVRFS